jgi:hypothetical protein
MHQEISGIRQMNLTKSINTAKTGDINSIRNKPEVITFSLNSLKTDFQKVNNKSREMRRNLENRLKTLEMRTNHIKEYSLKNGYPKSRYLKISLDKDEGRLEHKNMTHRTNVPVKSLIKYNSRAKILNSYTKNKSIKKISYNSPKLSFSGSSTEGIKFGTKKYRISTNSAKKYQNNKFYQTVDKSRKFMKKTNHIFKYNTAKKRPSVHIRDTSKNSGTGENKINTVNMFSNSLDE